MSRLRLTRVERAFYRIDREQTWLKQNKRCYYCRKLLKKNEITFDHVIPISKTGYHSTENCVVACQPCNEAKADNDSFVWEQEPREWWEQLIDDKFAEINENVRQFEYKLEEKTMGSYNKWVKYWTKRGRW